MKQIVDLHSDAAFRALGVELVSIAFDSPDELAAAGLDYGITDVPLLSDADHKVSEAYDVLRWAVASGEPGHTFILVDREGGIAWIRDYGSPENPDRTMYVEPADIVRQIQEALD